MSRDFQPELQRRSRLTSIIGASVAGLTAAGAIGSATLLPTALNMSSMSGGIAGLAIVGSILATTVCCACACIGTYERLRKPFSVNSSKIITYSGKDNKKSQESKDHDIENPAADTKEKKKEGERPREAWSSMVTKPSSDKYNGSSVSL